MDVGARMYSGLRFVFLIFCVLSAAAGAAERLVLIVAGQSNCLNWHAAAAELPTDPQEAGILFYHESGAPPDRGAVNATSGGHWTALGPQRQDPHAKFERDFFGPEISLGRSLSGRGVGKLAVVKVAYFGTNLALDWNPQATQGNRLYRRLSEHVATALRLLRESGEDPHIGGFFWMQGETDAADSTHAAAYGENLTAFIARLRSDLNAPAMPFIIGRIGPAPAKGYAHQALVRAAQTRIAESVPAARWVDTDDLPRDTDGIHLLAPGVIALGKRMADAWASTRLRTINK